MESLDYEKPQEISEHTHWVGTHDPNTRFQCNPYLIVVNGQGVLIDPGSVLFFDSFLRKVRAVIGLENISSVILQHQDPDVCGNIVMLMDEIGRSGNRNCKVYAQIRTAALVRHYGAGIEFEYTDNLSGGKLELGPGFELDLVHTPYLHAPGAIATYFARDKILFTSDIFGGLTDDWNLYAGNDYFEEITPFHNEYMPAKEILLYTMTKFEKFNIKIIAPQHGSVVRGEQVSSLINRFKDFECGLYIDEGFREELRQAQRKIEEQNRVMNAELAMAARFQAALFPDKKTAGSANGVDLAFLSEPSSQVSGDFLIIDKVENKYLRMMVIDVMGHGVTSGLATIQVKTLFEEFKDAYSNPEDILRRINESAFTMAENNIYFSAVYAVYDYESSSLSIASAGGVPPIYYSGARGKGELLTLIGHPIGLFQGEEFDVGSAAFEVNENDFLLLQTDGIIECFNDKGESFDNFLCQDKIIEEIDKEGSAQDVIDAVVEKARSYMGSGRSFNDDITIVVFKKE